MNDDVCWNCKRDTDKVRSRRTGKIYCTVCGATTDGGGAVTDLSLIDTEPVAPEHNDGEF